MSLKGYIGIDRASGPSLAVKPMRHRWHYERKGKMHGYVVCLRKGCQAIRTPRTRDQSCRRKVIKERDHRSSA